MAAGKVAQLDARRPPQPRHRLWTRAQWLACTRMAFRVFRDEYDDSGREHAIVSVEPALSAEDLYAKWPDHTVALRVLSMAEHGRLLGQMAADVMPEVFAALDEHGCGRGQTQRTDRGVVTTTGGCWLSLDPDGCRGRNPVDTEWGMALLQVVVPWEDRARFRDLLHASMTRHTDRKDTP